MFKTCEACSGGELADLLVLGHCRQCRRAGKLVAEVRLFPRQVFVGLGDSAYRVGPSVNGVVSLVDRAGNARLVPGGTLVAGM